MKLIERFILLILLINSHICFAETISAEASTKITYKYTYSGIVFKSQILSDVCSGIANKRTSEIASHPYPYNSVTAIDQILGNFSYCHFTYPNGGVWGDYQIPKIVEKTYSCSPDYFLSDASGAPTELGQFCTKTQKCEDKAAINDYILGHGFFIGTSSSVMCSAGCKYSNSGKSISWSKLKYNDHAGVVHECSVGIGAGSYFTATGESCESDGPVSNNYTTMQSAYNDCFKPFILADQQDKAAQTPTPDGSTPPTYEGDGYSTDGNSLDCPYGQSSGKFNGETVKFCLFAPSSTTDTKSTTNSDGSTTTTTETKSTKSNSDGSTTTTIKTTVTTTRPDGTSTSSTSTTSSTSGSPNGSGGSGGGDSDTTDQSSCTTDEMGKVSCLDVGDTSSLNSDSLESESKDVSYSVDGRFGSSGGACPFGAFTFLGHTYNQFEVVCDGVVLFKAIFLTICSIAAAYIVFGFRGGDD